MAEDFGVHFAEDQVDQLLLEDKKTEIEVKQKGAMNLEKSLQGRTEFLVIRFFSSSDKMSVKGQV